MTREAFLIEKFKEIKGNLVRSNKSFYTNPSVARIEPFEIADGLYYVGDKKVCVHLIDTGDGLILLDSGYLGAEHLLVDSIWRAGFDPKNVRWIIHTHAHSDHFGASCEFKRMYGTKLAISKVDAESIRQKPHRAHVDNNSFPYAQIPEFDYEIEDGEIFELGNVKIRCVLTPGHTEGVLSLFFNVTYNSNTYLAGMYGGAGVNAITLPYIHYNEAPEDSAQQMLSSIEMVYNEPVTVHLGNHPNNNHTLEKRERQLKEGGNPFIDPNSWQDFLDALKVKVQKTISNNEELEKSLSLL